MASFQETAVLFIWNSGLFRFFAQRAYEASKAVHMENVFVEIFHLGGTTMHSWSLFM